MTTNHARNALAGLVLAAAVAAASQENTEWAYCTAHGAEDRIYHSAAFPYAPEPASRVGFENRFFNHLSARYDNISRVDTRCWLAHDTKAAAVAKRDQLAAEWKRLEKQNIFTGWKPTGEVRQ